jgi:predicted RNA-binding protein YlqC (UPF0109 family)
MATANIPLREHKDNNNEPHYDEHRDDNDVTSEDGDVDSKVVEMRFLVASTQVGSIIGKAGANVKKVREESDCTVSILPNDNRAATERIMLLKGTPPQIAHASQLLADLLISGARERAHMGNGQNDPSTTVLRLLVHRAAIGAVIGKAGVVIRETQEITHARIQIANEALPGSTEKTVSVTGTAEAIHDAMIRMVRQLAANPLKPGTKSYPYNPGSFPSTFQPMSFAPSVMPIYPPSLATGGPSTVTSTQKIAIPTVCAGCVIGKGGSVIRDLRVQSGTNISIADPESLNPNERVVTLTGTPQGIHTAVLLIRQLVEQYQPPERYQQGNERY